MRLVFNERNGQEPRDGAFFTHEDDLMAQVGSLGSEALSVFADLAALLSAKGREVS